MFFKDNLADLISKPVEAKTDPFSLAGLIQWLEKQPGDRRYCYTDSGHCLLAQYFPAVGVHCISVTAEFYRDKWSHHGGSEIPLPAHFNDIASGIPHTFGAALDRARALSPIKTEG